MASGEIDEAMPSLWKGQHSDQEPSTSPLYCIVWSQSSSAGAYCQRSLNRAQDRQG